jgi:transposase
MGRKKKRRTYTPEFKAEAVDLVLVHGVSVNQTSRDLGVSTSTLGLWVQKARAAERGDTRREAPGETELEELKRLRRENRILREERDILKKAAAFFANESR